METTYIPSFIFTSRKCNNQEFSCQAIQQLRKVYKPKCLILVIFLATKKFLVLALELHSRFSPIHTVTLTNLAAVLIISSVGLCPYWMDLGAGGTVLLYSVL